METIGSKPEGLKGRIAGRLMNIIHSGQYKKLIKKYLYNDKQSGLNVLDIGCGGGRAVRILSSFLSESKVSGIDHSEDMVELSKKINKKEVKNGTVKIIRAGADSLPFPDISFDIVTAFDTINFWDNFDKSMEEVRRVLKKGGMFFIVNGYPQEGTKWFDFVKFKSDKEYRDVLLKHGFKDINIVINKYTIIIKALN